MPISHRSTKHNQLSIQVKSMNHTGKFSSFLKGKGEKKTSPSEAFLKNGSLLLEKLIAASASNGKYDIPIRSFTCEELKRATNNFQDLFYQSRFSTISRGSWENRPILVKKFFNSSSVRFDNAQYDRLSGVIKDIVTTAQMSHHKNVLKILGCCVEFEYPALVYACSGDELLLDFMLNNKSIHNIPWRSRLNIANDVASAVLYLHSAFQEPIIYRILHPGSITVDQRGLAKIFDFSFSISLPPGKLQVQDDVIGVTGYFDYEYSVSGTVSQKNDVYSFGVLLLVLLTGEKAVRMDEEGDSIHIVNYVTHYIKRNEFNRILDTRIIEEGETIVQEQQLDITDLALRCTKDNSMDRPNMIDVAKELFEITRRSHL